MQNKELPNYTLYRPSIQEIRNNRRSTRLHYDKWFYWFSLDARNLKWAKAVSRNQHMNLKLLRTVVKNPVVAQFMRRRNLDCFKFKNPKWLHYCINFAEASLRNDRFYAKKKFHRLMDYERWQRQVAWDNREKRKKIWVEPAYKQFLISRKLFGEHYWKVDKHKKAIKARALVNWAHFADNSLPLGLAKKRVVLGKRYRPRRKQLYKIFQRRHTLREQGMRVALTKWIKDLRWKRLFYHPEQREFTKRFKGNERRYIIKDLYDGDAKLVIKTRDWRRTKRLKRSVLSGIGVVIRVVRNNCFVSVIRSNGQLIKTFSSGLLKFKTAKKRRSLEAFSKIIAHVAKFSSYSLRARRISFMRILVNPRPGKVFTNRHTELLLSSFWKARIKVRRMYFVIKRPHSLAIRTRKLRRK
jgi:hypothetical protein